MEDLSLVVLNYNSYRDTITCVQSLKELNLGCWIIVVDNASSDDSVGQIKKSGILDQKVILLLSDKNGGYGAGNNIGIRYAKKELGSKYVGILNPDVIIPSQEIIPTMYNLLMKSQYSLVGGIPLNHRKEYRLLDSSWNIPSSKEVVTGISLQLNRDKKPYFLKMVSQDVAEVECVVGCFFLVKLDHFQEVGLFDENVFLYNEENIIGIKFKRKGYRVAIMPRLFYYHNHDFSKENRKKTLIAKLKREKVKYDSRKYLAKTYYSKLIIYPLFMIWLLNCVQISVGHLKHKVINGVRKRS